MSVYLYIITNCYMTDLRDESSSLPSWLRSVVLVMVLALVASQPLSSQISSYMDQLVLELEKRSISQEEFLLLLEKEGYDLDDLDNITREEALEINRLLEDYSIERFRSDRDIH